MSYHSRKLNRLVSEKQYDAALALLTERLVSDAGAFVRSHSLHVAIQHGAPDALILLLINSSEQIVTTTNRNLDTPLHFAVKFGASYPIIDTLVRIHPMALDEQNKARLTPRDLDFTNLDRRSRVLVGTQTTALMDEHRRIAGTNCSLLQKQLYDRDQEMAYLRTSWESKMEQLRQEDSERILSLEKEASRFQAENALLEKQLKQLSKRLDESIGMQKAAELDTMRTRLELETKVVASESACSVLRQQLLERDMKLAKLQKQLSAPLKQICEEQLVANAGKISRCENDLQELGTESTKQSFHDNQRDFLFQRTVCKASNQRARSTIPPLTNSDNGAATKGPTLEPVNSTNVKDKEVCDGYNQAPQESEEDDWIVPTPISSPASGHTRQSMSGFT